ncbi:MAG: rhomboid family intramembrane serine protease [Bdellovibrionales bacterium]|nr:rhomboid family intramembrane serine protease [Bdellovibrionales bacterium]
MVYSNIALKIVKLNIIVFLLWNFYGRFNPEFMMSHFLVSGEALNQGRIWTLVTSVFSHTLLMHILLNMFVFYNFGVVIERVLGSKRFFWFFILAGVAGSLSHCLVSIFLLQQPQLAALGASGAVSGIVLLFALLFPHEKIYILGFIPAPAIWAAMLITGIDLWGLISQTKGSASPIGYGAHLGGAISALIYYASAHRPRHPLHYARGKN